MEDYSIASSRHAFEKDEVLRGKARAFNPSRFYKRASSFKKDCLLLSDIVTYLFSVVVGFYLTASLKTIFFPELLQITSEKAISTFPELFGTPMFLLLFYSEGCWRMNWNAMGIALLTIWRRHRELPGYGRLVVEIT